MKAKVVVTGMADMILRLQNISERVSDNSRGIMRRAAKRIVVNAKRMTPVDTHDLEESIQLGQSEYEGERRGRLTLTVEAGGIVNGIDISEYAARVHETYDRNSMGPGTREKQAGESLTIGAKFLDRAHDMERGVLGEEIQGTVSKIAGSR